jgi:hypothetical protein
MEVSGQLHGPVALSRGNHPRCPLDVRLVGPHSLSGRRGEKKNLAMPGVEPGLSSQ